MRSIYLQSCIIGTQPGWWVWMKCCPSEDASQRSSQTLEKMTRHQFQLEQLERLRSEDTPHRLMITHTIESYWIQVKRRQSQSYKFKKFAKIANFWISKRALHATHLLKLLAKMCKYEIDPMSIVEDTERTRFCPQTDRRTRWYQYTPLSTSLKWGV